MDYPKKLADGVAVIGRYEPTELSHPKIFKGVHSVCDELGANPDFGDVRDPETNLRMTRDRIASVWHKDISYTHEGNLAMVVWSNREQTQVMLPDGSVVQPEPYDVVMIHNEKTSHRTPHDLSNDRWFFRVHMAAPEWL